MIKKEVIFKCQKELGQATLKVSDNNNAKKKKRITKAKTVNYILLISLI